ncbi:MAG: penicillin acylase family protein [Gemmatimonadaceae bacterium]|nr:penicillin acylase family protein [Gemmatimonadaceae bacterium]
MHSEGQLPRVAIRRPAARALLGLAVCGGLTAPVAAQRAAGIEVRFTEGGVAHVRAGTLRGAGEGYGWAFARDNLCLMVDNAITLAGDRSRTFGADSGYVDGFLGSRVGNVDNDVMYRYLLAPPAVAAVRAAASADVRALVSGYVRGFNRHVRDAALPGEECRRAPWFRPITEDDVWRRITQMPLIETSIIVMREIAAARPPGTTAVPRDGNAAAAALRPSSAAIGGSNAWAAGSGVLGRGNGGFSFSNPHFPWYGTERLHALHLTVPGRLDVFGSTLYGIPLPLIGFTPAVGWSLTHTTDKRSTLYELTLDPTDPTRYRVGDVTEPMRRVDIVVPAGRDSVTRTIWETRYGPVMTMRGLEWTRERAYAFADPERGNVRMADQFLSFARVGSVQAMLASLRSRLGSPWSNVTAADRQGNVLYSNVSVAGFITDAQLERCRVTSPARMFENLADLTVLNGADPSCAWTRDPRAPQAGIIPGALRPAFVRQDVAFNSNDSHWYATLDVAGVLEGFPKVIGPERTIRGERTRVAATYARAFAPASGTALTPASWEAMFFSSRNLLAELVLDDLLADCRTTHTVRLADGSDASLTDACRALGAWDRHDRLDSRGSMLFAEFARNLERIPMTGFAPAARYWRVPFDPADPVGTPAGFVVTDETRRALSRAAARITTAGVALDAPLGDVQSVTRAGQRLPMSGASFTYHEISPGALTPGKGITDVRLGDSYIHAVTLGNHPPRGRFIVTYSQSTNTASPHFGDMTAAFAAQRWLPVLFTAADIAAAQVGPTIRW